MKPTVLALALAVFVASCRSQDATGMPGLLTGTWRSPPIPSGAATYLVLAHSNAAITGQAYDYGIGPFSQLLDQGSISGQVGGNAVHLDLHCRSAGVAQFSATIDSLGNLSGTWTPPPPASAFQTTFFRQRD